MTREEEFELALEQVKAASMRAAEEAHVRFLAAQAPEFATPVPVIRDDLDAAFSALHAAEARQ